MDEIKAANFFVNLGVPSSERLFEPVESFGEFTKKVCLSGGNKAFGMAYVNLFV